MEKDKILIIDDEEDFLMIAKLNLESPGKYEVRTSPSAKEIISMVHDFKPKVILMDVLMPGVGGIDACGMLNNDPAGSKTPIIVISALSKIKDKLMAYKEGISDYLVKPVGKDELIAKIEKTLKYKEGKS